ncbi:unnamed protein product [marine sediment metagenome]|uniref:Uncharacterized protein n=1 Tax=marine sediment metagenome TaxID=412755 RepID=X1BW24_9ZZZZ
MPGLTNQRYQQDTSDLLASAEASENWVFRALDLLREILLELRIIKVHMGSVTDEDVQYDDIEEKVE